MVTVRSDEERVQLIINFFKDYKFYILSVILASAILVGGYFFSKSVKLNQIQAAKVLYEDWQETQVEEDREQLFQNLTENYPDTGYSHLALLKKGYDLAKENNVTIIVINLTKNLIVICMNLFEKFINKIMIYV